MKLIIFLSIFFYISNFEKTVQDEQIQLKKIKKMLCGDWFYDYSIKDGKKEVLSDYDFNYTSTKVFFRIEFRKMYRKEFKHFYKNRHPDYKRILKGTALDGIVMFGDYKGCEEYPLLLNDSTDIEGNLKDLKIQTYGGCMSNEAPKKWKSFTIDHLSKDTLVLSGYMGEPLVNKLVYIKKK